MKRKRRSGRESETVTPPHFHQLIKGQKRMVHVHKEEDKMYAML
jgi:hypothetical protein